ncbi:MAG: Phi13 family phage major tail protein, partial [Actinomyces urogenitalis DORA_12]
SAELEVEVAEATLYADDGASEVVKEFASGTLMLGIDDLGPTAAAALVGARVDSNGVLVSASEDGGAPVAIGFRAARSSGKYQYFWPYRVKFAVPKTSLSTKADKIEFATPEIEGTILRRNKPDAAGKHPWKAEVTEGGTGVKAEVITAWYEQVYEPATTTTTPQQ